MIVLLPEGRAVCNPDNIKLVKVVHSEVQGKRTYVVIVKLDDDSELMVKTLNSADEAYALANQCADLINASDGGDGDSDDDNSDEDDSDEDDDSFTSGLPASKEQSVKGTPSASESDWDSESALTQAASTPDAGSKAKPTVESSDWDLSSDGDESSSWIFTSEEQSSEESKSDDWDSTSSPASAGTAKTGGASTGGIGGTSAGGSGGSGAGNSTVPKKEEESDSSDWSMSVETPAAADDDSSSDWFSDDGFSAPVTSSVAKERHEKQFPKPVPQPTPVVEIRTPVPPQKHDDSLDDSDDWFVDDGNDDWY